MKVIMTKREMIYLSPGEEWDFPDAIAEQLIARGKALSEEMKEELKGKEKRPKPKKEED